MYVFVVTIVVKQVSNCLKMHIFDGDASQNMGHNQSKKFVNLWLGPLKLNGIHGKLNKIALKKKMNK